MTNKQTTENRYGDYKPGDPTFYRVSRLASKAEEYGATVQAYGDDVTISFTPEQLDEFLKALGVEPWMM